MIWKLLFVWLAIGLVMHFREAPSRRLFFDDLVITMLFGPIFLPQFIGRSWRLIDERNHACAQMADPGRSLKRGFDRRA